MKKILTRLFVLGVLCTGLSIVGSTNISANAQCEPICVDYYLECVTAFNPNTARCEPIPVCRTTRFCDELPYEHFELPR